MWKWLNPLKWYEGAKNAFASGWAGFVKMTPVYTAANAATKGGMVVASKSKARNVFDGLALVIGTPLVAVAGFFSAKWAGDKANDTARTLGFLTLAAGLTAIVVGAFIALRRR